MARRKRNFFEVKLGLNQKSVAEIISFSRFIVEQMTGNIHFPAPEPDLSEITTLTNKVEQAYLASHNHGGVSAAGVHACVSDLISALNLLSAQVEYIANKDKDHAPDIILSSGMSVRNEGSKPPRLFLAKRGFNSGTVVLTSKASSYRSAAYIYQISTNPLDPTSWTTIYMGTKVNYMYTGLIPGKIYYFRVAVSDKNGMGNWSEAIEYMAT